MRQIQEAEAPKLLPELLEAASLGESAAIMREGVKIAKIVPGEGIESPMRVAKRREKRRKAVAEFKKRREKRRGSGITWREFMEWRREGNGS